MDVLLVLMSAPLAVCLCAIHLLPEIFTQLLCFLSVSTSLFLVSVYPPIPVSVSLSVYLSLSLSVCLSLHLSSLSHTHTHTHKLFTGILNKWQSMLYYILFTVIIMLYHMLLFGLNTQSGTRYGYIDPLFVITFIITS